jgi:hypothetical protein
MSLLSRRMRARPPFFAPPFSPLRKKQESGRMLLW